MNTNAQITNSQVSCLLGSLVPPENKFSAANLEYDSDNVNFIKSYRYTVTTASILSQLSLAAKSPLGSNKSFVLSGPYGTGKSHLLLQYMSLISGDNLDILDNIVKELKKLPTTIEVATLLEALENKSLPRLLPVVVKSGLGSLRSAFSLSLQQALEEHNLGHLMPDIYGAEAAAVIERWQSNFPETFNAFVQGLHPDDTVANYLNRLRKLDPETWLDFNKRYQVLTSGSIFTPQNTAEPKALYASVLTALKNSPYQGITLIFDEFSKYLETSAGHMAESETKLLQDLAEYASRTALGTTPVLNFILVTHKDISSYLNHLPKNLLDGWRGVAERFTALHMPQNLEQTSILLGEATGNKVESVSNWLDEHQEFLQQECECLDISLKNILTVDFARRIFPLHALTAYVLVRLSENIGQNERSVYAYMSDVGPVCYRECLQKAQEHNSLLLTPEVAFDYFEGRIREQIYDQDFSGVYEIYQKAILAVRELRLTDLQVNLAIRIIKTIVLCELLHLDFWTKQALNSIFEMSGNVEQSGEVNSNEKSFTLDVLDKLIDSNILSVYLVNETIRLNRPDTATADQLLKKQISELQNNILNDAELWQNVLAKELVFYPELYNDQNSIVRYFRTEFVDYSVFKSERFHFVASKDNHLGTDGFVYFVLGVESQDILTDKLLPLMQKQNADNGFVNVVVPLSASFTQPRIKQLLLTLLALDKIKNSKVGTEQAVHKVLDLIEVETRISLGNVVELLTSDYSLNMARPMVSDKIEQVVESTALELSTSKDFSYEDLARSKTAYAMFTASTGVTRTFKYKFKNNTGFSDVLSNLCDMAFAKYVDFRNEMTVCTNPSGVSKGAVKEIIRSLFQKVGSRFSSFKPASQHMTIIRSILEHPGFIKLTPDWQDFELLGGNADTKPLIEFIKNWFNSCTREKNLKDLIIDLTSVKHNWGLRSGVIPLVVAISILDEAASISIINRKQKNLEYEFTPELFISMFDNEESIKSFKIRYRKVDKFHLSLRKALGEVFITSSLSNSSEIPTLDKVADAINNWFLFLPKFSRKTAFMPDVIMVEDEPMQTQDCSKSMQMSANLAPDNQGCQGSFCSLTSANEEEGGKEIHLEDINGSHGVTMFKLLLSAQNSKLVTGLLSENNNLVTPDQGITEQMYCNFVRKIAAFALVNPRVRYYELLPTEIGVSRTSTYEEIKNRLQTIKYFTEHSLDYLYQNMATIVTQYWEPNADEFKNVVCCYEQKLKCRHVSRRILQKNDVNYIISAAMELQNQERERQELQNTIASADAGIGNNVETNSNLLDDYSFNARKFLLGLAKEITKLDPKEWDVLQYQTFVKEIRYLGTQYLEDYKKECILDDDDDDDDLAQKSIVDLKKLLEAYSKETEASKDYITRDLRALFANYNLSDRSIVLTLLRVIEEKLKTKY